MQELLELVELGADIHKPTLKGKFPLVCAYDRGQNSTFLKWLIKHGCLLQALQVPQGQKEHVPEMVAKKLKKACNSLVDYLSLRFSTGVYDFSLHNLLSPMLFVLDENTLDDLELADVEVHQLKLLTDNQGRNFLFYAPLGLLSYVNKVSIMDHRKFIEMGFDPLAVDSEGRVALCVIH